MPHRAAILAALLVLAGCAATPASGPTPADATTIDTPPPVPDSWSAGTVSLDSATDPAILRRGTTVHLVVRSHDGGPGYEHWTAPTVLGRAWVNRTPAGGLSLDRTGDLLAHNGTVYLLSEPGYLYAGDSVSNLSNTSARVPVSEGALYVERGRWYAVGSEGTWRNSCCIGARIGLHAAAAPTGPWTRLGTVVDRANATYGTGDPYLSAANGTYYLFADHSRDHPYYRIALWTAPMNGTGPPATASRWTYRGVVTAAWGGDAQVVRYDGAWVMVNEFARGPARGIRVRTAGDPSTASASGHTDESP